MTKKDNERNNDTPKNKSLKKKEEKKRLNVARFQKNQ
jgi:hypothetical protein